MAVVPATDFTHGELTALWNRAYEGYFVPIRFDEQLFARHLRRAAVDLALSRVIAVDGIACGISLAGRRGLRGYLAGFGIAQTHRRHSRWGIQSSARPIPLCCSRHGLSRCHTREQGPRRLFFRIARLAS